MTGKIIKYFGYGSNRDLDMMIHMVGRDNLVGVPGKLLGYELCTQNLGQIRTEIPKNSPWQVAPQQIIRESFGEIFDLYVARPKIGAITYGTIWDLTPEDLELVKEWELVDYGMQEEVNAIAQDMDGNTIAVETQALMLPPVLVENVIAGDNYPSYVVDKNKMLEVADRCRANFLKRKNKD